MFAYRSLTSVACIFLLCAIVSGCSNSIDVAAQTNPDDRRQARIDEFVKRGEAAIVELLPMLRSSSPEDAEIAADSLSKIGSTDGQVIDALGDLLDDSGKSVTAKQAAATALGRLGSKSVPHLIKALNDSQIVPVVKAAAEGIEGLDLDNTHALDLVLARKRVEEFKNGVLARSRVYGGSQSVVTRSTVNALGEVTSSRQYRVGPSRGAVANQMERAALTASELDEAIMSLDRALSKLGVVDVQARQEIVVAADQAAVNFDPFLWKKLREFTDTPSASITSLDFSRDGRWLASADQEGVVRLYRSFDGTLAQEFSGHKGSVSSVAVGPTGVVASGGTDKTVRIWDTETGQSLHTLEVPTRSGIFGSVQAVTFDVDGQVVMASCSDDQVYFWNVDGGRLAKWVKAGGGRKGAAFSDEGEFLAVVGSTGGGSDVKVFGLSSGEVVSIPCYTKFESAFAVSSDGRTLATAKRIADSWYLKIIDLSDGGKEVHAIDLAKLHPSDRGRARCLDLSPDGHLLAIGAANGKVRFWSTELGRSLYEFSLSWQKVTSVRFSSDGDQLAVGTAGGMIHLYGVPGDETTPNPDSVIDLLEVHTTDMMPNLGHRNPLYMEKNWSDSTGAFQRVATFVSFDGNVVVLKLPDGRTSRVPISRLSEVDQVFIRTHTHLDSEEQ